MTSIKIALLSILLLCIAVPAFGADTVHTYDTVVHYDTTYLYDTTVAVQEQLNEIKSEFYDRAMQSIDDKRKTINKMLEIISVILIVISLVFAFMTYLMQRSRQAVDNEIKEIRERRLAIDRVYDEIVSREKRIKKLILEIEERAEKSVAAAEREAMEKSIRSPEERIRLINEAEAERSIEEYERLLFEMEFLGIPKSKLPTSLIKNVGLKYFIVANYEKALDELLAYTKVEPTDCDALFIAARCHEGLRNHWGAIAWYDALIKADPSNIIGYNYWVFNNWGVNLERLFYEQKDTSFLEQAIEKYKMAVDIDERFYEAHFNWGVALMNLGSVRQDVSILNEALAKYRKTLEIDEKAHKAYGNLSITLLMKMHLHPIVDSAVEAKAMALKALELAPHRKDYYYLIACADARLGKKSEMLEALKIAIEHDTMFKKDAKEKKDFEKYWDDPDFIALTKED